MTKTATTPKGAAGKRDGLTPKQERFVGEYLKDLNATQAAIRAGYSAKTAEKNAHRLMGNEGIVAAVAKARQKTADKLEVTRERVLGELAKIAFADIRAVFTEHGALKSPATMPPEVASLIDSIDVTSYTPPGEDGQTEWTKKVRFHNKLGALQQLVRFLGLDAEKPLAEQPVNVTVETPLAAIEEKLAALRAKRGG